MPFTDKEYQKEYNKEYHKEYYIKNRERIKEHKKEYRIKNRERILEYNKEYKKTENGKKKNRINTWKKQGIIYHDYNILYDIFINTKNCDDCNRILTEDERNTSTTRCLDHDHYITDNENVRGIVCNACNLKRG